MTVIVRESTTRPSRTAPTDTGTAHYVGTFRRGPTAPTIVTSEVELARLFGPRWSTSADPDYAIAFFRLGGGRMVIRRRVGPASASSTLSVLKGASASLTVTADEVGAAGNAITFEVAADVPANTAVLTVRRTTTGDTRVEVSPALASQADAAAWSLNSNLVSIDVAAGAAQWPPTTLAAAPLAGGNDDLAGVTDAALAVDLVALGRKSGPGQLIAPGKTSTIVHDALLAACASDTNKRAVLDAPVGALSVAVTAALAARTKAGAPRAAMFRGRLIVQGADAAGSYLTVPWSVVQAAMLSRNDAALGNPNEAAAGEYGDPAGLPGSTGPGGYILGLLDGASDADLVTVAGTGLNPVIDLYDNGTIQVDGDDTLADPVRDPLRVGFANSRVAMFVVARGYAIGASYRHRQVDATGVLTGRYAGDLIGVLSALQEKGAVFGTIDDPGYVVDVGASVNTPATIAARELHARIGVRYSPGAKFVFLDVVTFAVNEGVR